MTYWFWAHILFQEATLKLSLLLCFFLCFEFVYTVDLSSLSLWVMVTLSTCLIYSNTFAELERSSSGALYSTGEEAEPGNVPC